MNPRLQEILSKHKVGLFEFVQLDNFRYVLRTDEPVSDACKSELRAAMGFICAVEFELLPEDTQPVLAGFGPSMIAHPPHYNAGKIEVIEAIEDWKLTYHRGNAVKYIARAGKKDPAKECEDLQKAVWYLNREIEKLTAAKEGRDPIKPNDMNPQVMESIAKGQLVMLCPVCKCVKPATTSAPISAIGASSSDETARQAAIVEYAKAPGYDLKGEWIEVTIEGRHEGDQNTVLAFQPDDQDLVKKMRESGATDQGRFVL